MNKVYIRFSSVTHAMRAKEIIEQNGSKVIIRRTSMPSRNEGCGYAAIVTGNTDKIISLLKINQIKYIGYEYL